VLGTRRESEREQDIFFRTYGILIPVECQLPDLKETGFMSGLFKSKNAPKQKDQTYNVDVAQNKDTSPAILDRILSYNRTDMVACLAVANPNCPTDWVEKIAKKALGSKEAVPVQFVLYALRNPNCPAEALSEIARKSQVPTLQKEALLHQNMDEDTLRELEQKADDNLRSLIVRNPHCPVDILTKTALGKRTDRAALVAVSNPNCPPDTLFQVLSNFAGDVLSFTALKHPNCPMEIIHAILLRDEDDQISRIAASRTRLDERTIRMVLARNKLDGVSRAIGTRSDAPKDAVKAWKDATGQNMPMKAHEPK